LQEEMVEVEVLEALWLSPCLRENQLELISRPQQRSALALGLTQIQSTPGGGSRVLSVSIVTSNPQL
jgi:hypothetical protein